LAGAQKLNLLPGISEMTRKDRLWTHVNRMQKRYGEEFGFMPQSFVLPKEFPVFRRVYEAERDTIWIVKPSNSCCGRGIFLLEDLEQLSEISKSARPEEAIVSRYVDPYLIQGLKFDLRVYVLITSVLPLRAFVYREGLVRFASQSYSNAKESRNDTYMHLTNVTLQKKAESYVENRSPKADDVGHKWSISALNRHLSASGVDTEELWDKIVSVIVKSLISVEKVLASRTAELGVQGHCFQLLGFDILLDKDLQPRLLEVNGAPALSTDSPLDLKLKGELLPETFNLVGISPCAFPAASADSAPP
jgi:hypothetical protein